MHYRSIVRISLVAVLFVLAACGSAPTAAPSSTPPPYDGPAGFLPASLIAGDGNTPTMEWGDPVRAEASLRQLFLGYVDAVAEGNGASAKADFLTPQAFEQAIDGCAGDDDVARFEKCVLPANGSVVIQNVKIVDELHAELTYIIYGADAKASTPKIVPVLLTGRGPRFESGTL